MARSRASTRAALFGLLLPLRDHVIGYSHLPLRHAGVSSRLVSTTPARPMFMVPLRSMGSHSSADHMGLYSGCNDHDGIAGGSRWDDRAASSTSARWLTTRSPVSHVSSTITTRAPSHVAQPISSIFDSHPLRSTLAEPRSFLPRSSPRPEFGNDKLDLDLPAPLTTPTHARQWSSAPDGRVVRTAAAITSSPHTARRRFSRHADSVDDQSGHRVMRDWDEGRDDGRGSQRRASTARMPTFSVPIGDESIIKHWARMLARLETPEGQAMQQGSGSDTGGMMGCDGEQTWSLPTSFQTLKHGSASSARLHRPAASSRRETEI